MTSPEAAIAAPERRLHPWSWLFVLLQQLKQFVVPLAALFFFGQRGGDSDWWPLVGVGVLALVSIWQYFTYRYHVGADSLVIRSGLLERSLREIPFARIHNVAIHQSALHRVFGVAEVRLESAGGQKPEAQMRVLTLADALALEAVVRRQSHPLRDRRTAAGAAAEPEGRTLLQLPLGEVLRHGLVSNRGLIVVAGGMAALQQSSPRAIGGVFEWVGRRMTGYADAHHFGLSDYAFGIVALLLAAFALLRLFSMLLSLLQYHGFRLDEVGRRLTVERGLLTRLRSSTPRRRIQAWTLREGLVHRLLKRRSLQVDSAATRQQGQSDRGLHELAPIATPAACDALAQHLLPRATWPPAAWQPLHSSAWLRIALAEAAFALLVTAVASWRFGVWGLLGLGWCAWAVFVARRQARCAGYAVDGGLVAVRAGWWSRHWRFAEIDKLQALRLSRSPVDRRFGTATLHCDTAGAHATGPALRLRFLPVDEAESLLARLTAELARSRLRW